MKNFDLLKAMSEKRLRQYDMVIHCRIASEARVSRIVNRMVLPTKEEIRAISKWLEKPAWQLGLEPFKG